MSDEPAESREDTEQVASLRRLVERLPQAAQADARVVETHISLLLLAGDDVYKFKKPVRLPFADFSDPAERKRLCHAELRLNRRLAPALYRGVVRVTGSQDSPRLCGRGKTLAHAVYMHRFPASDEAPAALADGRLDPATLSAFGKQLAEFHAEAEPLPAGRSLARPADLQRAWRDDLNALEPLARGRRGRRLRGLADAWRAAFEEQRSLIAARRRQGRVRACHGDLHLGNLVLLDGRLTAFDCIEFNDEFRYIDVMNELAFLVMDLERHREPRLAVAFLDGYLQSAGDYAGLALLRLFSAYRASVRAKVAALRLAQQHVAKDRRQARAEVDALLALASRSLDKPPRPRLVLMHGVSGTGKSYLAARLAAQGGYLRVRSDVERRRLYAVGTAAGHRRAYTPAGIRATYSAMCRQVRHALDAGFDVIADATFGGEDERRQFLQMAATLDVPVVILDLRAPVAVLERRVAGRAAAATDVSQADLPVLHRQLEKSAPLTSAEQTLRLRLDTSSEVDVQRLERRIRRRARPACEAL